MMDGVKEGRSVSLTRRMSKVGLLAAMKTFTRPHFQRKKKNKAAIPLRSFSLLISVHLSLPLPLKKNRTHSLFLLTVCVCISFFLSFCFFLPLFLYLLVSFGLFSLSILLFFFLFSFCTPIWKCTANRNRWNDECCVARQPKYMVWGRDMVRFIHLFLQCHQISLCFCR